MIRAGVMRLPWRGQWVPHALLDVGRRCDVACAGCYNGTHGPFKNLEQLESELTALLRARRLQTITLTGGEPTLHPQLHAVVRMAARRRLKVALLTNGAGLNKETLLELRQAGLSVVLLHVQPGQQRPDIAPDAEPEAWRQLRAVKAALVKECGIEAGLSWITRKSRLDEVRDAIREVLASPHLHFLLVTGYRDFRRFSSLRGSVSEGLRSGANVSDTLPDAADEISLEELRPLLQQLALRPFGFVGSSHDPDRARWLTFLTVVSGGREGRLEYASLRPGWSDVLFSQLLRLTTGRLAFFFKPSRWQLHLQLALNACTGGRFSENLRLLRRSFAGGSLLDKHIVLQEGPTLRPDGEVEFCRDCPDAVWQGNALVPVCLAVRMAPA